MIIEEFQYDYRNLFNELLGKINPSDISGINWEQRRYEIAKTVIHGQLTGPIIDGVDPNPGIPDLAKLAVKIADALIAELKKGGEQ